mmetsp:Transcript_136896/g.222822  ORF Transcript_136896/g.222822 Transcript_136896/m.222822 type:complete len:236 (+) Transcript_136896:143-850(+)
MPSQTKTAMSSPLPKAFFVPPPITFLFSSSPVVLADARSTNPRPTSDPSIASAVAVGKLADCAPSSTAEQKAGSRPSTLAAGSKSPISAAPAAKIRSTRPAARAESRTPAFTTFSRCLSSSTAKALAQASLSRRRADTSQTCLVKLGFSDATRNRKDQASASAGTSPSSSGAFRTSEAPRLIFDIMAGHPELKALSSPLNAAASRKASASFAILDTNSEQHVHTQRTNFAQSRRC